MECLILSTIKRIVVAFVKMEAPGSGRRADLISEAAVERGRVNNALDKLRQVEPSAGLRCWDVGYPR
jgi:hypothetical protein